MKHRRVLILFSWKPYQVSWWPHALCHSVVCFKVIISLAAPATGGFYWRWSQFEIIIVSDHRTTCILSMTISSAAMGTFSLQLWGEWPAWSPAMLAVRPLVCPADLPLHWLQSPCQQRTKTAALFLFSALFFWPGWELLGGGGVGTVKPISWLLLAQVNIVGVEVESDHISLGFQCLPPQVCPIVGGEGLQVLILKLLLAR